MGFEDPDRPDSLERIIAACGGEAIDYPAKVKCCGFPIIQAREDTALAELIQPIEQAKEAGADAIVTPCPLCHLSLDAWQSKLKKQTGKDFQMPILHLSQLIGVAAGLEGLRAPLQAPRRLDAAGAREAGAVAHTRIAAVADESMRRDADGRPRPRLLVLGSRGVRLAGGRLAPQSVLEVLSTGCPRRSTAPDRALSDFHLGAPLSRGNGQREGCAWAAAAPSRHRLHHRRPRLASARRATPPAHFSPASIVAFVVLGNHDVAVTRDPFSRAAELRDLEKARLLARRVGDLERFCGAAVSIVGVDPQSYRGETARPARAHRCPDASCASFSATSQVSSTGSPTGRSTSSSPGHLHAGQICLPLAASAAITLAHPRASSSPASTTRRRASCTSPRTDDVRPLPVLRAPRGDGARP